MIEEVTIRRFKRFGEQTIPLGGNIVLAGQNNSGKTTVLQAIAAWSLAFKQWKLLNDTNPRNGYAKKPISRQTFNAVPLRAFDLMWHDRDYRGTVEIDVRTGLGWSLCMELMADSTEQIYVRPKYDTPTAVVEGNGLDVVYVSSVDGLEIEEGAILNPEWIRTLMGRQRPGSILRNLLLDVSQGNRWADLCKVVDRLFKVELLVPQTPGGQVVCEFRRAGDAFALDIMSAGSGFHQVLLLLACLHAHPSSVLLIDEPDAHLHVFLQDTIFSELRAVAAAQRSQIILATHSEVIFRAVPFERLVAMIGEPRRLSSIAERDQLVKAMGVLDQTDILQALAAPGVMYFEGYTDLNLLRAWARVLEHPSLEFLEREPFWKPLVWQTRDQAEGIKADDHFKVLKLVKPDITGIRLIDSDGKAKNIQPSAQPEAGKLNRIAWRRYETESYLLNAKSLARFIGDGGDEAVRNGLIRVCSEKLGEKVGTIVAEEILANPFTEDKAAAQFLSTTKARTEIIGAILQEGGIHGLDYTEFDQIAAQMLPEEIHPEVKEKLDFIQQAFGL